MMDLPLDDETLQRVYAWIDEIPLSRPKKSIARDFSDGILAAEVVAFYFLSLCRCTTTALQTRSSRSSTTGTRLIVSCGFDGGT